MDKEIKMTEVFRQGEVLFERIERGLIDKYGKKSIRENMIFAEGEQTGHMHKIADEDVGRCEVYNIDRPQRERMNQYSVYSETEPYSIRTITLPPGEMLLKVTGGSVTVEHPEHKPLKLFEGEYAVRIQREYDEAANRRARD